MPWYYVGKHKSYFYVHFGRSENGLPAYMGQIGRHVWHQDKKGLKFKKKNTLNKTGSVHINVTLGSVRVTFVTFKINRYHIFQVCVWRLNYPACNTHVTHMWSVMIYLHFPTLRHKRHDFQKRVIQHTICFDFLCNFDSEISQTKKNSAKYYHTCNTSTFIK